MCVLCVWCRLVTLQSCILDNEVSLDEIVREINTVLEGDVVSVLVCQIS